MIKKSALINARIEPGLKEDAEKIIKALGLSITEAITLFYKQITFHNGIPFELKVPNEITEQTFKDSDEGKNIVLCKNAQDMFDKLGI